MNWQEDWDAHLWPNYGTPPIQLSHGRGHEVWDTDGNRYVDLLAGIAVSSLGHAHPGIIQAVQEQVERLGHTSNLYANEPTIQLAKALHKHLATHKAFFCNSGTEANEAALKLVRRKAHEDGKEGVILAFSNGFHGRSTGALALTGQPKYHAGFGPLPGSIVHVPYNDVEALEQASKEHTIIGVFAEPIQGEGGIIPMTPEMAKGLRRLQDDGALLVMDEVQTGVGRTGDFFAHTRLDLQPDIVTLAKGLGGGLPIGATLARAELADIMSAGTHGSTFGGNPIAAAAACAVLHAVEEDFLDRRAARLGKVVTEMLDDAEIPVRGAGLLLGVPHEAPAKVVEAMRGRGYLVGVAGQTVRLAPPLTIPEDALQDAVRELIEVFQEPHITA